MYVANSPDGFQLTREAKRHSTEAEARAEILEWKKRYKEQGYYSSNNGRIPYNEIENYCKVFRLK